MVNFFPKKNYFFVRIFEQHLFVMIIITENHQKPNEVIKYFLLVTKIPKKNYNNLIYIHTRHIDDISYPCERILFVIQYIYMINNNLINVVAKFRKTQ